MKKLLTGAALISGILLVGGCATVPTGPSVMALPGAGKSFEQFRADDGECRRYAFRAIDGINAGKAANENSLRDAGVGAGTGLIVGSMSGAETGERSSYGDQRDYDHAYVQCMYGKGHRVPVSASLARSLQQMSRRTYTPPSATGDTDIPPPPPGY